MESEGFLRRGYRNVAAPVGLLIVLAIFNFIGARLFMAIEGPYEEFHKNEIVEMREEIIEKLWNNSHRLSTDTKGFAQFVKEELKRYETQLHTAFVQGINSDSDEEVWDIWGSLIYCTTIYTTVGYGHMAPATDLGRIVTILYGFIGIPLCLIVLAELGKQFTYCIKLFLSFVQRGLQVDSEFNLTPVMAIGITAVYISAGAFMYNQWEEWSFFEAFYFIFISISTIGFGDVLPSNKECFIASFIYQLIGLALVGMVINVVMETIQGMLQRAQDKAIATGKTLGLPKALYEDFEKKTV